MATKEGFESDGGPPGDNGRRRSRGNGPRSGGRDGFTAQKVVSEIGTDRTKWPDAKHFTSWLGW